MSSDHLFNFHCPRMYGFLKCLSNCKKAFNVADKTESVDGLIELGAIVKKSCTGLIEKLSTLNTLTECSSKIYPLIAKPEENAKCRKMCCSKSNAEAGLYACNKLEHHFLGFSLYDYQTTNVDRIEDMCQLACVIDQAAKHAHIECSTVLTEMLLAARQDVQKIYQQLEKKIEEEKRFSEEMSTNTPFSFKIHFKNINSFPIASRTVETTTTIQPTVNLIKQDPVHAAMNERYFYKMSEPIKTEEQNF
uniref:CPG4 domain-containing protein n=1 Tax=Panagrellus redivivus TaxID=6233 RepID=A0A7E4WAI6_PANRE